jgi:hypothetical protein
MDTVGAVLGPSLPMLLLYWFVSDIRLVVCRRAGLHRTQGILAAMIAEVTPPELKGTALWTLHPSE